MSILVSGGAGYIGSHTCVELIQAGYDIVVADNLSNSCEESIRRVEQITGKTVPFLKAELCDPEEARKVFEKTLQRSFFKHTGRTWAGAATSTAASTTTTAAGPSSGYIKVTETTPVIVDSDSFAEYLEQGPCLFIGDGAGKCADVLTHPNAHFCQCHPKASSMLLPALNAFRNEDFKDVAYFEPFYLKEFVATVSKKKLF